MDGKGAEDVSFGAKGGFEIAGQFRGEKVTSPIKRRLYQSLHLPAENAAEIEACKQALVEMPEFQEAFPSIVVGDVHSHSRILGFFDEIAAAPVGSPARAMLPLLMSRLLPAGDAVFDREVPGYTESAEWQMFASAIDGRMLEFIEGTPLVFTDTDILDVLRNDFAIIEESIATGAHEDAGIE